MMMVVTVMMMAMVMTTVIIMMMMGRGGEAPRAARIMRRFSLWGVLSLEPPWFAWCCSACA